MISTPMTDEQIIDIARGLGWHTQIDEIRDNAVELARAAIAAHQRQQLISVEDRLPPEGDTLVYAIHVDGEPEIVCASLIHETFPDRAYSHWMPLPPAPEGS